MNAEVRNCQSCRGEFAIEPEDFGFYQKIQVPPPTWCPACRMARRMVWRNERSLYKSNCSATGKSIISMFPEDSRFKVYEQKYWWGDGWDPMEFGREYNFNRTFFEQYAELTQQVPSLPLFNTNPVNSEYCNFASNNKDCYLFTGGGWNEKVLYGNRTMYSKESADVYIVEKSELCYECSYCQGCYQLLFARYCEGCSESAFLFNCRNCNNCFGCTNQRNKSYYIFNRPYSKEEYREKIKEFDLSDWSRLEKLKERFSEEVSKQAIHKFADLTNCVEVAGDHVRNARNCSWCFDIGGDKTENCKFINWGGFVEKDSYDTGPGAGWKGELLYETLDTIDVYGLIACVTVHYSRDIAYSINCHNSHDLFGCYGLRNKSYCILNRQYGEEEYKNMIDKIKSQMAEMPYVDAGGRKYSFGEFFPVEISPFAYNETVAQEYFPLTKNEATGLKYPWKDSVLKNHTITINTEQLPNSLQDIKDVILGEAIACVHGGECAHQCTYAFKIIPAELELYRKLQVAIPRLCPNCRHYERVQSRNPLQLWHRKCMKPGCPNEFETSYAPERPETVYCETCYNSEIA